MKLFFLKNMQGLPRPMLAVLVFWVKGLCRTLRLARRDSAGILDPAWSEPAVFACWHNRLLCLPALLPLSIRERTAILASRSRDGGYIADFLDALDFTTVRGSSSRGGAAALIELVRHLRGGGVVAVTPDGPRGPRCQVQDGVLWLAAKTKAPIIPISINAVNKWELNGWDRTQIPKPFTRAELVTGEPIEVTEPWSTLDRRHWCRVIEEAVNGITR